MSTLGSLGEDVNRGVNRHNSPKHTIKQDKIQIIKSQLGLQTLPERSFPRIAPLPHTLGRNTYPAKTNTKPQINTIMNDSNVPQPPHESPREKPVTPPHRSQTVRFPLFIFTVHFRREYMEEKIMLDTAGLYKQPDTKHVSSHTTPSRSHTRPQPKKQLL